MAKDFIENPTCSMKFDVDLNQDGNIAQEGEMVAGKKTINFSGIKSDITIDETINTENSPALHNGIAGLMWLFTGRDDNFDELSIKKNSTEIVDYV